MTEMRTCEDTAFVQVGKENSTESALDDVMNLHWTYHTDSKHELGIARVDIGLTG